MDSFLICFLKYFDQNLRIIFSQLIQTFYYLFVLKFTLRLNFVLLIFIFPLISLHNRNSVSVYYMQYFLASKQVIMNLYYYQILLIIQMINVRAWPEDFLHRMYLVIHIPLQLISLYLRSYWICFGCQSVCLSHEQTFDISSPIFTNKVPK